MMRVAVFMLIEDADLAAGWGNDDAELEATIKATLHELVGDDGNVYVPKVLGIEVDTDA